MKHAALLTLLSFALSCPVMAKPHSFHYHHFQRHHHHAGRVSHHTDHHNHAVHSDTAHASHSGITCEMVRAYVAKVGMGQAIALAKSAGISATEEERARQCLAKKI
jgi:hypothetical protein